MENINLEKIAEEKKEKGKKVVIHVIFERHGEKEIDPHNPQTGLTPKGEWDSMEVGRRRSKKDAIKGYSSNTPRTIDTVKLDVGASPTEKKLKQRKRFELEANLDPNGDFMNKVKAIRNKILGDDYNEVPTEEQEKRNYKNSMVLENYYLKFGDKRPDPNSYSPVETAAVMARLVNGYVKMTKKIESEKEIDLIHGTHDFNLDAFLSQTMVRNVEGRRIVGFNRVEEIGGPMDYNEQVEVLIKTNEEGEQSLKMFFRGNEYEIDKEKYSELIAVADSLKNKADGYKKE